MAIDHAIWLWINTPKHGVSFLPTELFTEVQSDHLELNCLYVCVCPQYVLEVSLQVHTEKPISRLDQFSGFSKHHSSTVRLMKNTRTNKFHHNTILCMMTCSRLLEQPFKTLKIP